MSTLIKVQIPFKVANSYPIWIGKNIYDASWLSKIKFSQIVIITDETVKKHYGLRLQKHLLAIGHSCLLLAFPAGEKFKNNKTKQAIENAMLQKRCDRDSLILALGGGVVGDLAGFIASTYLRGVRYIQIPTTLLAMVDSSVGGKTAINTAQGKNLIGTFYQPIAVIADIVFLESLTKKHIINGLIEAIKLFLTYDANSFSYTALNLPQILNGDVHLLKKIISKAIKIKAAVIERDEKELGERSVLNFGHTIGHALEKMSNYKILHGYAVAFGILVETAISHRMGFLKNDQLELIKKIMSELGIHGKTLKKYDLSKLIQATQNDKKNYNGKVHYTLLHEIGFVHAIKGQYVHAVSDKTVIKAFKSVIEG